MIIPIGGDQASYTLKIKIIDHFERKGIDYFDLGNYDMEVTTYYLFVDKLYNFMRKYKCKKGILMCGSGLGASIVMNKYPGIRCGRCDCVTAVELGRKENDMNVLSMGGRVVGAELAIDMVEAFLNTAFDPAFSGNVEMLQQLDRDIYKTEHLDLF